MSSAADDKVEAARAEGYRAGLADAAKACDAERKEWELATTYAVDDDCRNERRRCAVACDECADRIPAPVLDLGVDTPWRLLSVLEHLIATARVLLNEHNYAGHGYELMREAQQAAE